MERWLATPLASDRLQPLWPLLFVTALIAGIAVHDRVSRPKPLSLHVPAILGVPTEALPEESPFPATAQPPIMASTPALPSEFVPPAASPDATEPGAGATAGSAERAIPTARTASDALMHRLPQIEAAESGAGKFDLRAKSSTLAARSKPVAAASALLSSLMKTMQRLRAVHAVRAAVPKQLTPAKPTMSRIRVALPATKVTSTVRISGWTLGGAVPLRGVLGGPAPLAIAHAGRINGTDLRLHP